MAPLLLPLFSLPPHPAALRAGNRIPPDQVGKFKERKQILDQIVAKDAEQMKRTCIVRSYLSVISGSFYLHSGCLVTRVIIQLCTCARTCVRNSLVVV